MRRFAILSHPRSGSTPLTELLRSHPLVYIPEEEAGEILSPKHADLPSDEAELLAALNIQLNATDLPFVGFKLFPSHLQERRLTLSRLLRYLRIDAVIVHYRENAVEAIVSEAIAMKTGEWYRTTNNGTNGRLDTVSMNEDELRVAYDSLTESWVQVFDNWPIEVNPLFLRYEDFLASQEATLVKVLDYLKLEKSGTEEVYAKRQNPANLREKLTTCCSIDANLLNSKLELPRLFNEGSAKVFKEMPIDISALVPNREPLPSASGIVYRVAEPYMSAIGRGYVNDALDAGCISSAGAWPQKMSDVLKKIYQVPVAHPCCNGFASLALALQCAKIGNGHEVIVPSFTMVAVPNAVSFTEATPVFVDNSVSDKYNPSWDEIERAATSKTKAVIVTHTYGVPTADLVAIAENCRLRRWILIEDVSECVGVRSSDGRLLGTFGDYACSSLYANKIVHGADAGFVLSQNPEDAARLASICNHGFTKSYHFLHFEAAPNFKVNGLGAAMAAGCLEELPIIMRHRSWLSNEYRTRLNDLPLEAMPTCGDGDTPWVFGVECRSKIERTNLRKHMINYGIETRDYFFPLHIQPAYQHLSVDRNKFLISEHMSQTGLYLPTHTNLNQGDVQYICQVVRSYYDTTQLVRTPPMKKPHESIRIDPDTLEATVRQFASDGRLVSEDSNHTMKTILQLRLELDDWLQNNQQWDDAHMLTAKIEQLSPTVKSFPEVKRIHEDFVEYVSRLAPEDKLNWTHIQTLSKNTNANLAIDDKLSVLLDTFLHDTAPQVVFDVNCKFGKTAAYIANSFKTVKPKIFAIDTFKWKPNVTNSDRRNVFLHSGYINKFNQTTEDIDEIQPIVCATDYSNLGSLTQDLHKRVDLAVFHLESSTSEDLIKTWDILKECFIAGTTRILFSGIAIEQLCFMNHVGNEMQELARVSNCRAMQFLGVTLVGDQMESTSEECVTNAEEVLMERRLFVEEDPGWSHHHGNAFSQAVEAIRTRFHDDDAECVLIPAVEQFMCDHPTPPRRPWVGIIHSVEQHDEHFYVPDMRRLCSPAYRHWFTTCKGLFTLTHFQADYLNKHLRLETRIPIQPLKYPLLPTVTSNQRSTVLDTLGNNEKVNVVMIGHFARDFDYFVSVKMPAIFNKQLLCGEELIQDWYEQAKCSDVVSLIPRANDKEYEKILESSIIFLALKHDGAANTLILECIERNCPIVVPRLSACTEYIGENYPLLYEQGASDLSDVLTPDRIERAIEYLQNLDKNKFTLSQLLADVTTSAVHNSTAPIKQEQFDVTICLCSFKRTHNLPCILDNLWNKQQGSHTFEIVIWNNNYSRKNVVDSTCKQYTDGMNSRKSLKVIHSTENYHCVIRVAMAQLMKSNCLLICDDDIVPGENFVAFFMTATKKHPRDVLCLRGHYFLPHKLNLCAPERQWIDYDCVRFSDDDRPERMIHFVHADVCLIPKPALHELASVAMSDGDFRLVDDYWMSFVLSHKFGRKLRKLCASSSAQVVERTDDSDDPAIAMHKRRDVWDARIRMYIHHMLQGWPNWKAESFYEVDVNEETKMTKKNAWDKASIGFNVYSYIEENEMERLASFGISVVRLGAVTAGREVNYEFYDFCSSPDSCLKRLTDLVHQLRSKGIKTVITLHEQLADAEIWQLIAKQFADDTSVIGYDLINEPYTTMNKDMHWSEVEATTDDTLKAVAERYSECMMKAIRKVDKNTPIILEPTFWASVMALKPFCEDSQALLQMDDNVMLSIHFYDPRRYTWETENQGRFSFPGMVPLFGSGIADQKHWDETEILRLLAKAKDIAEQYDVKLFVGETGICRGTNGADKYLRAVLTACRQLELSVCLYGFCDPDWDAMDYELGVDKNRYVRLPLNENFIMKTLLEIIKGFNS